MLSGLVAALSPLFMFPVPQATQFDLRGLAKIKETWRAPRPHPPTVLHIVSGTFVAKLSGRVFPGFLRVLAGLLPHIVALSNTQKKKGGGMTLRRWTALPAILLGFLIGPTVAPEMALAEFEIPAP